jgi:hypothetical protein
MESHVHAAERRSELGEALETALNDGAAAERYRRSQIDARRGRLNAAQSARPLEFDESGFPIPQRAPSFVERVARLLGRP